jgi:hypothetical protein
MKLTDFTTPALSIILPPSLVWEDEFNWTPVQKTFTHGVGGSLIIQSGVKEAGRAITLRSPDQEMGWMYRPELLDLFAWAEDDEKVMTLHLEKATDTRTFKVVFAENPIESSSVQSWKDHTSEEPFIVKIKLIEVL